MFDTLLQTNLDKLEAEKIAKASLDLATAQAKDKQIRKVFDEIYPKLRNFKLVRDYRNEVIKPFDNPEYCQHLLEIGDALQIRVSENDLTRYQTQSDSRQNDPFRFNNLSFNELLEVIAKFAADRIQRKTWVSK